MPVLLSSNLPFIPPSGNFTSQISSWRFPIESRTLSCSVPSDLKSVLGTAWKTSIHIWWVLVTPW